MKCKRETGTFPLFEVSTSRLICDLLCDFLCARKIVCQLGLDWEESDNSRHWACDESKKKAAMELYCGYQKHCLSLRIMKIYIPSPYPALNKSSFITYPPPEPPHPTLPTPSTLTPNASNTLLTTTPLPSNTHLGVWR